MAVASLPVLTPNDYASDQEVRWCPGCGDFSILAQLKKVLASLGLPRENLVFLSGVGCASRTPYYLDTYGFHGVQGRAPALATGLKMANPHLQVWVVTGDGDSLSVGANHLLHAMRRNVDIKVVLFNNEVFGLSKGQYSPTARVGTRTRSSPEGSVENPLRPVSLALGAEATFVARTIDIEVDHMSAVLERAAEHRGSAFVEIYQNCKIFNDGVFEYATEKSVKDDDVVYLDHGHPLQFGPDRKRYLRLNGFEPEIVSLGNGVTMDDVVMHDERSPEPSLAFLLSRLTGPNFPECLGVFRAVEKPTYEDAMLGQILVTQAKRGVGRLDDLLAGDDAWTIE